MVALIGLWFVYQNRTNNQEEAYTQYEMPSVDEPIKETNSEVNPKFICDGRQYCSQMTSCEEAIYFLNHCDEPKMDGNHDGVPCEKQWCY